LYELIKNPEVQEKLRDEIEDITNGDSDKKLTYDELQGMTYLDQVICETLRFHTPISVLQRGTTKDYKFPGTDFVCEEGLSVWINVMAIHFNPDHYANPDVFDPEHFSKEAKAQRNP